MKGLSAGGSEVMLTRNEVTHAREFPRAALFVLSHIEVSYDDTGNPVADGGVPHVCDPWNIDDGELTPLAYSYRLLPQD